MLFILSSNLIAVPFVEDLDQGSVDESCLLFND
jgi:hypothetical protein